MLLCVKIPPFLSPPFLFRVWGRTLKLGKRVRVSPSERGDGNRALWKEVTAPWGSREKGEYWAGMVQEVVGNRKEKEALEDVAGREKAWES